ncbi:MAG TPA: glycerol-3-phosphate dehydrogenase, partial [Rhizobiales bacterium]|nr:glycerol-3-phosphate dehydrogenase [Hyphomicrobiales bacterium]
MAYQKIGIAGGGAWGTALAQAVIQSGRDVLLWAFEAETVRDINDAHVNRTYLPGIPLDPSLRATGELAGIAACDAILMVAP